MYICIYIYIYIHSEFSRWLYIDTYSRRKNSKYTMTKLFVLLRILNILSHCLEFNLRMMPDFLLSIKNI